jgi:hypothetical protein
MLNTIKFIWPLQHKMWAYSANQATDLENIFVQPEIKLHPMHFSKMVIQNWIDSIQNFGEIAIVQDLF